MEKGTTIKINAGGSLYFMAEKINEDNNWYLVTTGNKSELFSDVNRSLIIAITMAIVTLAIALLISLLIASTIVKPIVSVDTAVNGIASGNADLTKRLTTKAKDEVGSLVNGFNNFVEKLQNIMAQIQKENAELDKIETSLGISVDNASSSITEILASIESIDGQIQTQSDAVSQTSSAVAEIAENINSLEMMIQNQAGEVSNASSAVEQMIGNIGAVNSSVEKMANSFGKLEYTSKSGIEQQQLVAQKISEVASQSKSLQDANIAIASIANQTNLLAMNAAIEAAHAGEAGKGFAVVADEIRKLSETSTVQSKKIGSELKAIAGTIQNVVEASALSKESFNAVSLLITETDELVRQISAAMEEQQTGSKQILDSLKLMNDSTTEVKNAGQEMKIGNQTILKEVHNLQDTTQVIRSSMKEMHDGAKLMNNTSVTLSDISSQVRSTIRKIGDEIYQFKV